MSAFNRCRLKTMVWRRSSVLLCLGLFVSLRSIQVEASFDFYVFAQSWQAEFCAGMNYPGCMKPQKYWINHFTVHGLWPELNHGPHPGHCSHDAFNGSSLVNDIGMANMTRYWPDVKYMEASSEYNQFWEHEWSRHGTCSHLNETSYFESAIETLLRVDTPSLIQQHIGATVSFTELQNAFGGKTWAALQCTEGYLMQVLTCWEKDAHFRPAQRMECPPHIINEGTCQHLDTIGIRAFTKEKHWKAVE